MAAGAQFATDNRKPNTPADVSPPVFNRWIRPDNGRFEAHTWDNRRLTDVQKAANPCYDARWEPFAACMAGRGYEVHGVQGTPFSQADLDRLVERVNDERPDGAANKRIAQGDTVPGLAGAFLDRADEWLTISYEDLAAHGLRALEPGEAPPLK